MKFRLFFFSLSLYQCLQLNCGIVKVTWQRRYSSVPEEAAQVWIDLNLFLAVPCCSVSSRSLTRLMRSTSLHSFSEACCGRLRGFAAQTPGCLRESLRSIFKWATNSTGSIIKGAYRTCWKRQIIDRWVIDGEPQHGCAEQVLLWSDVSLSRMCSE